jgi:uncharacterized protein
VDLIYLDSCLVIYLLENHPRWGERMTGAIAQAEMARFSISSLVKCECLVAPMKRGDPVLERAYSQLFDPICAFADAPIRSTCRPRGFARISD